MLLEPTYRSIWRLSLPLMGSTLIHQLVGIVDTRFMAELSTVDSTPLAAVGLGSLVFMMLSGIPMAFSMGGQIMVARRVGEGRQKAVGTMIDHSTWFMLALGVLLLGVILLLMPPILGAAINNPDVLDQTLEYLRWRSCELPLVSIYFSMYALFAGLGRTRVLFWAALLMTGSNVVLDYALVFGHLGLPRMELAGAGVASMLATGVGTAYLLYQAFRPQIRAHHDLFRLRPFDPTLLQRLGVLSGPMVVQFIMGSGVWLYFFTRIEALGEDALAISNVVKLLYMVLGTTTWGLGNGVNTLVSNLMGQGRPDDVLVALRRTIVLGVGMALVAGGLMAILPEFWLGLFTVERPDLVALGVGPLLVTAGALVWMSIAVAVFRTVSGLGATRQSLIAEVSALPFYLLYIELVIGRWDLGLSWAWGSEFVYWTFTALGCILYLRWGRWREIVV